MVKKWPAFLCFVKWFTAKKHSFLYDLDLQKTPLYTNVNPQHTLQIPNLCFINDELYCFPLKTNLDRISANITNYCQVSLLATGSKL